MVRVPLILLSKIISLDLMRCQYVCDFQVYQKKMFY